MSIASPRLSQYVRRSTSESAADQLRDAIIQGELPMGFVLSEYALAEQLGVSRTPIREALRLLAQEGLVQIRPFSGANVFRLNRIELRQLVAFREMLELAALEEALNKSKSTLECSLNSVVDRMKAALASGESKKYVALDADFHEAILKNADNPLLAVAYDIVASRFKALRTVITYDETRLKNSLKSHIELIESFSNGPLDASKALLVKHIAGLEKMLEGESFLDHKS